MKLQHTDSRALLAGVTSLGFLFALFLTECVCFAVNIRSGGWVLPVAFVLSRLGGLHTVWWAFPCAEIFAVSLCCLFLYRVYQKEIAPMGGPSNSL